MIHIPFNLHRRMLEYGYPRWMVDVYFECFDAELAEITEAMNVAHARAMTSMWKASEPIELIARPEFHDYARFVVAAVLADARKETTP